MRGGQRPIECAAATTGRQVAPVVHWAVHLANEGQAAHSTFSLESIRAVSRVASVASLGLRSRQFLGSRRPMLAHRPHWLASRDLSRS